MNEKKTITKSKTTSRVATMAPVAVEAASPATAPVVPARRAPSREEISRRAYEIYVARGQAPGRDLEDWVQAERELAAKAHRNN